MVVLISNRQKDVAIDNNFIEMTAMFILEFLGYSDAELSVSFVEEEESRFLNKTYRNKDKDAEVLSFPMEEGSLIGDVVIAPRMSKSVTEKTNEPLNQRLAYMLTHGVLHLSGYLHEDDEKALEMEKMEDKILLELKNKGLI